MTITCAPAHHPAVGFRMVTPSGSLTRVSQTPGPASGHRYSHLIPDVTPDSDTDTAATAREWVTQHTPVSAREAVALGVSELIGNVLRHAPGPARIALTVNAAAVVLSVSDEHPEIPIALPKTDSAWDLDAEGGRGLAIIAAMAQISVRRAKGRKRVTARFPIGGEQ